ncbi:Arabinose operon regulatory protein [Sporomusa ovata DSM 2662]|uniref:Response regulator containing CheY-like receiver domain and AraC-type DNA-binding domain n=1 Tax=Sporomusa ovata TaxID=2378 RepID=A0A0U1KT09_9FIRM|nr:PocR ligand-binding domain-containing protein [Sporomusa ovata]EQB26175.1 transcriptional regulator, AraC family [Sporomusa ovata DSM 2662]CQR70249.1 Response regulator containing CheY-like receiver domain and AraC-type DNA-binding domain [Sporomusa ovata]
MVDRNLVDLQYLEDVLDNFSKATGLHVAIVNKKGESFGIFDTAERCGFCRYIRSKPSGVAKCRASYKQATQEASKWEEPYFFRCRAGLVIWAVPISLRGISLGSIICSQVLLWKPDRFFYQELRELNPEVDDFTEMEKKAGQLDIISPARFQAAADVLYVTVNQLMKRDLLVLENVETYKMQQRIHKELENRKLKPLSAAKEGDDYGAYLHRERSFLRYIRLGDKSRAEKNLHTLLTQLFVKSSGDQAMIKLRISELATLASRAAVEGGAVAETVMVLLDKFNEKINDCRRMEEFFFHMQHLVTVFLNRSVSLEDKKHGGLVNEAKNFILESYSRSIKIDDVAAQLFISPSHLSRLFRQELNCTVNDYITRVRVEQAVELMKKPELSVAQVSQAVGFQSQSYFAKVFSKHIGVAPLIYRNSLS